MDKILIAESERDLSLSIKRYLELFDIESIIANDGVQALNEFGSDDYQVVIIDDELSRIKTNDVIKKLKDRKDNIRIILLSSKTINKNQEGCDEVISRPFTSRELKESLIKVGYALW